MLVNSVSSSQAFGHANTPFPTLGDLSDNDLRYLAYAKASHDVNDKKHRRISDMLYYAVPVAAGVAEAVKPSALNRIGRVGAGLKGFLALAIPFAIIDATFRVKNSIDKHSSKSAKFTQEHPVLSAFATLGAGVAGIFAFNKGLSKFGAKYGKQVADKLYPYIIKLADKLDASKVLNFASKQLAKVPSAVKEFSKAALDWSPWMLIFANIAHSVNHDKVKNNEYLKNYQTLKELQTAMAEED